VLRSSSPPRGTVKTPTNQVSCIVPYNFRRMSIRLRSCRCGTQHNAETKFAPVFQSQCSKGQESLPFPPEPMLKKNQERLMIACLCRGFVLAFAEFFPIFPSGFSQCIFCTNVFKVFPFAQTCPPGNVSFL